MTSLVYPDLSWHYQQFSTIYPSAMHWRFWKPGVVYAQTISDDVRQLVLPSYHVYHHFWPILSCVATFMSTCASLLHLTVGHVAFYLANILLHTTSQVESLSYRTCMLAFVALLSQRKLGGTSSIKLWFDGSHLHRYHHPSAALTPNIENCPSEVPPAHQG